MYQSRHKTIRDMIRSDGGFYNYCDRLTPRYIQDYLESFEDVGRGYIQMYLTYDDDEIYAGQEVSKTVWQMVFFLFLFQEILPLPIEDPEKELRHETQYRIILQDLKDSLRATYARSFPRNTQNRFDNEWLREISFFLPLLLDLLENPDQTRLKFS